MSDERIRKLAEWAGWICAPNPYGKDGQGDWLFLEDPKGKT